MNALDTNIWLYFHDKRDPRKQAVAKQLTATVRPLVLPWQVGCEFIAGSRKLVHLGFTETQAWSALAAMEALADAVLLPATAVWRDAERLQHAHMLSFWDALLVAACILDGVKVLYTEDLGSPRTIETLTLINPFLVSATP